MSVKKQNPSGLKTSSFPRSSLSAGSFFVSQMKNLSKKKSTKLVSLMILILLLSSGIFLKSQATNFSWNQISWIGNQSNDTAKNSTDANGTWTNYSAKDANLNINGSGDAELKKADNWSETADADFNANTSKDTTLAVNNNSIKLLKPNGAACSAGTDCQSNTCTNSLCSDAFTCGANITKDSITYGTIVGADGRCWLDRNLGADRIAIARNDVLAYGWLFQWGRNADGHQVPTSGYTAINSNSDTPGHADFITEAVDPEMDWRVPQNNNLWQGVNGINNPCPAGFRLPTAAEWSTLVSTASITNYTAAFNSSLKLTAAGARYYEATLLQQGDYGYYWSSSINSTGAFPLFISSSGVDPNYTGADMRVLGFSVRCIKN